MTKKKSSSGRIIFILLLILLTAGGIFGYKYYSKNKTKIDNEVHSLFSDLNKKPEINFPVAGIWYLDNPQVSSEYVFESPAHVDGKKKGKLSVIADSTTTAVLDYEIITDSTLKISDPKNATQPHEISYQYNAAEQKLVIIKGADKNTYSRTKPVNVKKEAEKIQTQLWMDKIADVDWKIGDYHKIRFNKPTQEGDIITGEYIETSSDTETFCKYTRLSDGVLNMTRIKSVYNGVETPLTGEITFKMELDNEGKTLTIDNGYRTYILTR